MRVAERRIPFIVMTEPIPAESATAPEVGAMSKTWYFTYGSNHTDAQGNSLGGCYTPITVTGDALGSDAGFSESRRIMMEHRGPKYCTNYESAEAAGVEKWNYIERSLESVSIHGELKAEKIAELLHEQREHARKRLAKCDEAAAILAKLPIHLLDKVYIGSEQIDLDNLSHAQATEAMRALAAGRWERKPNGMTADTLDYAANVDGIAVRLWSAGAPESCRVVEYEETIPAHTVKRRKLVCNPA